MQQTSRRGLMWVPLIIVALVRATWALAPCPGDCDDNRTVTVEELVTGVNIALGDAGLTCHTLDTSLDERVTVDELVASVNSALHGCPAAESPTPTASPSPTPTPTFAPGVCGNGVVDFDRGETCDDGNTLDGDSCPANCVIHSCTSAGTTRAVDVSFAPPAATDISGIVAFLRYPDGVVSIRGTADGQAVYDSVSNSPDNTFITANDLDYALRMVLFKVDTSAIPPGLLFTVQFEDCEGAATPTAADFSCTVESAADTTQPNPNPVSGVTCSVTVH